MSAVGTAKQERDLEKKTETIRLLIEFLIQKTKNQEIYWELVLPLGDPQRRFDTAYKGFWISLESSLYGPVLALCRYRDESWRHEGDENVRYLWSLVMLQHDELSGRGNAYEHGTKKTNKLSLVEEFLEKAECKPLDVERTAKTAWCL